MNEQEKKRAYNERILQTDHGTLNLWCFQSTVVWEDSAKNFAPKIDTNEFEKKDLP